MIEHFFVLKPDGKIYHIPDYPESFYYANDPVGWKRAVQSAIDNAVEVSNQEEVKLAILKPNEKEIEAAGLTIYDLNLKVGTVYSLQCSVEIQELPLSALDKAYNDALRTTYKPKSILRVSATRKPKKVALVTFSQPEREETQEELWDDAIAITGVYYPSTFGRFKVIEELSKTFTITRKTP